MSAQFWPRLNRSAPGSMRRSCWARWLCGRVHGRKYFCRSQHSRQQDDLHAAAGGDSGGITRDSLITLARDSGYSVVEEPISRDQLYIADEVFVCGTAAEVVALREIDFRVIGEGQAGPVTRALQQEFDKVVSGRHARSAQWLAPVPALNAAALKD